MTLSRLKEHSNASASSLPIRAIASPVIQKHARFSGQTMTLGGRRGWDRPASISTVGTAFVLLGQRRRGGVPPARTTMARTSLIEDLFDMLRKLPWWVGVATAAVFWIVGLFFSAGAPKDPLQTAMRPLFKFAFNGLAILVLVAAAVSAIRSLFRRKMLDRQTGIDSLRTLSWREFEQLVGEAFRRQGSYEKASQ